ncbi:MAG: N-acetyltransferase [Halioglobus sp.]
MPVTIRRAVESDAVPLAHLAELTFRQAFTADNSDADMNLHCESSFGTKIQRAEILDVNTTFLLAVSEGAMIGFGQLRLSSPKDCVPGDAPAELYRIYVLSDWHGSGVAHSIMSEALGHAAANGSDAVWLGVWEHNNKAISFYRKHGFGIVGEHEFRLGDDVQRDLVLAADLTAGKTARI